MTPAERVARREPLDRQLEHGPVSVRGVRLTRESFAELAALDLAPIAAGFAGDALVIGVTRDGAPDAALRILEPRATVRTLGDPLPVPFGELHLRKSSDLRSGSRVTRDVRADLDRELVRLTVEWAAARA